MADSRITGLPVATTFADTDAFVIDSTAAGNRQISGAAMRSQITGFRNFQVTFAGTVITVTAGTRILRNVSVLNYAGGTINVPSDGTFFLLHLSTNALSLVSGPGYPGTDNDSLLIARVVRSGGVITTLDRDDPLGGNMRGERNLLDVLDPPSARVNLGVNVAYTVGTAITGPGDTPVTVLPSTQGGTIVYAVSPGTTPYTRTVSILTGLGAQTGARLVLIFAMAAGGTGSATVEVRSASSTGVLLYTATMGPVDRRDMVALVFTGTTWVMESGGPTPFAGQVALTELVDTRAPAGGIRFDGTVARFAESIVRGVSIGSGDYSAVCVFRCMPNPDAVLIRGLLCFGSDAGSSVAGQVVVGVSPANGAWTLGVRDAATTLVSASLNLSAFYGRTIQLAIIRRAGVLTVMVDGNPLSFTPPSSQAQAMVGPDTAIRLGFFNGPNASYAEPIYGFQLYNRALTSPELRLLAFHGVAVEDRNALGIIVSGSLLNGDLENWTTPGVPGVSSGVAPDWLFNPSAAAGSVTKNTIGPIGGLASLLFTDGSGTFVRPGGGPASMIGRRARFTFSNRRLTGSQTLQLTQSGSNSMVAIPPVATGVINTGSWEYVVDSPSGNVRPLVTVSGTGTLEIDNAVYESIGCLVDIDCGAGSGFSLPDIQGRFPAAIAPTSYSNFQHVRPSRRGQFLAYVAASGNTQIAGLPVNARISSIIADAAGAVTLSVGNASGGSQIVASVALAAGRQDLTVVSRYTTTQNLWVNLSAAVAVTLTVNYDIVS